MKFLRVGLISVFVILLLFPQPVYAQYSCTCNTNGTCTGDGCTSTPINACGAAGCSPDFQLTAYYCGATSCGQRCAYYASCVGPGDCSCLANGNCADPDPASGKNCSTGGSLACGAAGCPSNDYRPLEQKCGTSSCGYKCILDQTCITGFCSGSSCIESPGTFLCGDGGCNGCSRYVKRTDCNGSECQVFCSADNTCGTGCGGPTPGPGPTDTPGPPPPTPGGPSVTPTLTVTLTPTPTQGPVGYLRARAVIMNSALDTCDDLRASSHGLDGTQFAFTPSSPEVNPPTKIQTSNMYVTFGDATVGTYTIIPTAPGNWVAYRVCSVNDTTGVQGEFSGSIGSGETIVWDIGYLPIGPWIQTVTGDTYASGFVKSFIPNGASPRFFNLPSLRDSPGTILYVNNFDFDEDPAGRGRNLVSPVFWLANIAPRPTVHYYALFYNRLGQPAVNDNFLFSMGNAHKPTTAKPHFFIDGDFTVTNSGWSVQSDESIIMLINGDLTINGQVRIDAGGFLAFIVNGDIRVSGDIGTEYDSTDSVLDGIYIATNATHTAAFHSGLSTTVHKERLVGRGSFIADTFVFERDLSSLNHNIDYAAEYFIYWPQLLLSMPDTMKEIPLTWEEVAP